MWIADRSSIIAPGAKRCAIRRRSNEDRGRGSRRPRGETGPPTLHDRLHRPGPRRRSVPALVLNATFNRRCVTAVTLIPLVYNGLMEKERRKPSVSRSSLATRELSEIRPLKAAISRVQWSLL